MRRALGLAVPFSSHGHIAVEWCRREQDANHRAGMESGLDGKARNRGEAMAFGMRTAASVQAIDAAQHRL